MLQKIIEHPLRKIILDYNDAIPESDYEKQLLQAYIIIHDKSDILLKKYAKLYYDYKVSEDIIEDAEIRTSVLSAGLTGAIDGLKYIISGSADFEKATELTAHFNKYSDEIVSYSAGIVMPMQAEQNKLGKRYNKIEDDDEKFTEEEFQNYHNNTCSSLYTNYDNYSLNLVSYDTDENNLRELYSKFERFRKEMNAIISRYESLIEKIEVMYKEWDTIKLLITE
jgi:DNA repair exonuclease SbcCD ATPase subunit